MSMKKSGLVIAVLAFFPILSFPFTATAQQEQSSQQESRNNDHTLPEIVVSETPGAAPVQEDRSEPASITTLPKSTIEKFGGPAQTNPYKALNLLPSVNTDTSDGYGLVQDQNSIRIRGQSGGTYNRLSQTINGMPIGVNVGQGAMGNFLDLENVESLSLIRGAIPADQGFGFGNSAGALDMQIREPMYTKGATAEQKVGSFGFTRSFARLDTGELPSLTRFFSSVSYSQQNTWRGVGDTDRFNLMAGLAQPMAEGRLKFELYGIYNKFNQDEYRPLTYAQTKDMSKYRDYGFNSELTGVPSTDVAYYDYNRQYFDEWAFFGKFEAHLWDGATFTFKPYYGTNHGQRYYTPANSSPVSITSYAYTIMGMEQRQFGYIAQVEQKLQPTTVKLGVWYQNISLYPPPIASQRSFILNGMGSYFNSWTSLSSVGDRTFQAPFVQTKTDLGRFHLTAGIKYLEANLPEVTGYTTSGVGNVSYNNATDTATVNPATSTNQAKKNAWLPNAGVSFDITDSLTARFMYGKNYAYPTQGPLYNVYNNKYATFIAKGITLQSIWDNTDLETSDNFDVGLRYDDGKFAVAPTLFYSQFHNKQVTVYDQTLGLNYIQSNSEAESMGAELESSWKAARWLTIFGAASYNQFQFTKNLRTAANTTLRVKGNQVPDVPLWQVKGGVILSYKNFQATPFYRYIDCRYGDVQNKEQVNGYHILDLYLTYDIPGVWKSRDVTLSLSLLNILDQRYIAIIRNSDDSQSSSVTYYPGAPFTAVAGIKVTF